MVIDELLDFVNQLYVDGKPDLGDVSGIVVIAYSPDELGVDWDEWHLLMDTYVTADEAMEVFITKPAANKCIITWSASSNWPDVLNEIDEQISNIINNLK